MLRACIENIGFDDRKLMLIGIPLLSLLMPILLDLSHLSDKFGYWTHQVPESVIFVTGFWMFYRFIIIRLRRKYPSINEALKRIVIQVAVIVASAPILKNIFAWFAYAIMALCNMSDHEMPGTLQTLISIYLPSFLIVAIYEAIFYFTQYKEAIVDRERLETQHVQAELDNLRNQINPHFLFNSLNTLMNLIPTDPETAMDFLSKLSKFYRYSVSTKEDKLIPLSKEIEFTRLYIDLLKVRFRNALNVNIEMDAESGQMIPPLSIQLLLENAVKHNVVSIDKPLSVTISFDAQCKEIVITNNFQKKIESISSTGIGLENIKRRFEFFTKRPVKVFENVEIFQVSLPTISV